MGRPPCCDKSSVKKGPWTEEEDLKLISYTNTHGTGNWTSVPKKAGLKRCGKSCRLRWTNYLRPNLKHESFTPQEEEMIVTLHATIGSRWSAIAHHLPGRTDNDIKNYWNTKLSKKLVQKGIDPITHRPISQVMESIAGIQTVQIQHYHGSSLLNVGRGISCLNRNLKNVFLSRSLAPVLDPSLIYGGSSAAKKPFVVTATGPSTSNEGSSSSTAATAHWIDSQDVVQPPLSPDLDWTEFLVEDALVPDDRSSNVGASEAVPVTGNGKGHLDQFTMSTNFYGGEEDISSTVFEAPYGSSSTSFIDAILDQEKDILLDFPDFLDNPDILP